MTTFISIMKRALLFFSLIIMAGCINAQNKAIDKIPAFHILTTDSVYVTQANLKKNKPVMIIYFSPDCSHCQHMMYDLKPEMKKLAGVQVVMVTFSRDFDIRGIREFYRDFDLKKYPNFTLGTEGYTMQVQRYYDVKTTPYIAVYDHNGKLVKAYDKAPKVPDLMATIKKA